MEPVRLSARAARTTHPVSAYFGRGNHDGEFLDINSAWREMAPHMGNARWFYHTEPQANGGVVAVVPTVGSGSIVFSNRSRSGCSAMRGLVAARDAVLGAIAAIDADMKRLVRASEACRRLMTIPGVGPLTALAFTAAIDDPTRFRRSRDLGPYLGLVPRRYQSGEIDYTGSISKVGDRRVRTLLYEAANVMLTRYKGELKLKDWAFAIAKRSNMRKARIALARRLAIIMHAMLRHGTEFKPA